MTDATTASARRAVRDRIMSVMAEVAGAARCRGQCRDIA
jgi:hypothetical protein